MRCDTSKMAKKRGRKKKIDLRVVRPRKLLHAFMLARLEHPVVRFHVVVCAKTLLSHTSVHPGHSNLPFQCGMCIATSSSVSLRVTRSSRSRSKPEVGHA